MKSVLIFLAALFASKIGLAQGKQDRNNTLLWKVTGNGLAKPSYLFGTMHALCADDFEMKQKVKAALGNSDKLVLELNTEDPKEMMSMMTLMMSKTPLSKKLSAEQYKKFDSLFMARTGESASAVDNLELTTIMSLLALSEYKCSNYKMWEAELTKIAKKDSMQILALETIAEQMAIMQKAFPIEEMLKSMEQYDSTSFTKMSAAYKREALEELSETMNDEKSLNEATQEIMLNARNRKWAQKLPALMKEHSLFVAVGAGHLWSKEFGLIQLLRKAGYEVTPVF